MRGSAPTRSGGRARRPRDHVSAGLTWHVVLPSRTQAQLGARKPQATVEVTEPVAWSTQVPVPVARALDSHDGDEPESRAELCHLVSETARACCMTRLVDMLSRREYSCSEATERLRLDGYLPECAEQTVSRAREGRLIDDGRFAESFVRSKLSCGWGTPRIERELKRRGVDPSGVLALSERDSNEGDLERAREMLEGRRLPERNAYPKLVRYLAGRGYSLDIAKRAASQRLEEASEQGLV